MYPSLRYDGAGGGSAEEVATAAAVACPLPVIERTGARFAECKRMGGGGIVALLRELYASGSLGAECPGLGSDASPALCCKARGGRRARRAPIAHPGRAGAFSSAGDSIATGRRAGFPGAAAAGGAGPPEPERAAPYTRAAQVVV